MIAALVISSLLNIMLLCLVVLLFKHFDVLRRDDVQKWQQALDSINESHAQELQRLANMKVAGVPNIPDAVRIPMKPDAEARVASQIRTDTIRRGAENLVAEYAANGMALTLEEAMTQAESMLSGRSLSLG